MHKAFLLILCLLVCTPMVVAQRPNSGRPTPGPVRQEVRPASPIVVTKEMMERLRPIAQEILEKQRARERARNLIRNILDGHRAPAPEPPSLGGWVFGTSAVVPPGPIPTLSDSPAIGDWGVDLKGFNGSINFGWSEADSAELNRTLEGLNRSIDSLGQGIEELNRINRAYAVPNPPTVLRAPSVRHTEGVTALAASSSSNVRRVVKRATVRSDPGSFFVNTLEEDDHFRVKARRDILKVDPKTGEKHNVCYFYGDALGGFELRNVWINCDRLEKQGDTHPTPRPAVKPEFHKPGPYNPDDKTVTTRDHLYERFALQLPFPETPKGNDGRATAKVKPEVGSTQLFAKYDPSKRNDPITHGFSDPIATVYADPSLNSNVTLKVRYVSEDRQAAIVNYVVKNLDGSKSTQWVFIRNRDINITMPPEYRWP